MEFEQRPDPDKLLRAIEQEEKPRAILKIFLGMCAGVGKTYSMLESAHQLLLRGADIQIGYVETHGRAETDALVQGLPMIPRKSIEYRGSTITEMDLDAILDMHPEWVLIDELAHTNAPGSRHPKRYQDVLEILDAGINVITTLNVQHVESRADIVRMVTGTAQREMLPDLILDRADEIELVDLSPDALLHRLAEGKVYHQEAKQRAAQNFFRRENLIVLREIALRITAERVDKEMRELPGISGSVRSSAARILVAISAAPHSAELIRSARRQADSMNAAWVAVYVDTLHQRRESEMQSLNNNIMLARDLGAEIVIITDSDIINGILRAAHTHNISQILLGRSLGNPWLERVLHGGTINEKLMRAVKQVDILIVSTQKDQTEKKQVLPFHEIKPVSGFLQYALPVLTITFSLLLCQVFIPARQYRSVGYILLFLLSVLSLIAGRGPLVLGAIISSVAWDYFFIPPYHTFLIQETEDILMILMFFLSAMISGIFTGRLREKEQIVRRREEENAALLAFTRDLSTAGNLDETATVIIQHAGRITGTRCALYTAQPFPGDTISPTPHKDSTIIPDAREYAVAAWVWTNKKIAGHFTETLPMAALRYYPLVGRQGMLAVLGIDMAHFLLITPELSALLDAFTHQAAMALERVGLGLSLQIAEMNAASEKLYQSVISSVSHELRTPLAVISSAAESLNDPAVMRNQHNISVLGAEITNATRRLQRLVENLLDMNRIESGTMMIKPEWCDMQEIAASALHIASGELKNHKVKVQIHTAHMLYRIDPLLIEQALANLLINAAHYTPQNSQIVLDIQQENQSLMISVQDNGPGIPAEYISSIFDKFYRVPGSRAGGSGLGLSIVKGFAEAHGGSISAMNNQKENGLIIQLILPVPMIKADKIDTEKSALPNVVRMYQGPGNEA
jgi:two-component system sensor histidine kinase KdpD